MSKKRIRAIAFYLPQFYPTQENDEWWEPGFTEWTNVASAKPLFKGHYQPRIPRDLGFYDLRVSETREKQAQLAREAGIEGFCYWHYWFGNGKRLLADVFREVVESGKPDYPFCLCWANHSWYAKTWDPNTPNKLLVEQTYPGVMDYTAHFNAMLPAFKDKRYMRMNDGRLIFGIFEGYLIPDPQVFFDTWNRLAKENGLVGFYFFGLCQGHPYYDRVSAVKYDAIVYDALTDAFYDRPLTLSYRIKNKIHAILKHDFIPNVLKYEDYVDRAVREYDVRRNVTPCIDPDFDHSPRSLNRHIIMHDSTPAKWGSLIRKVKDIMNTNKDSNHLLFIKSWNEWGEGNYLEPDRKWGKQYIEETAKALRD